ncbi:MAG: DNA endonuclease SmrA [Pseudomonadales bacterium]
MASDDGSTEDDFAKAMADVAPLKHGQRRVEPAATAPAVSDIARDNRRAAALGLTDKADPNPLTLGEVPPVAPQAVLEWKKDGVQLAVFAKLRAGQYPIDDDLDLHGLTVKEARGAVYGFINRALGRDQRTLLIAHGRGEKSATPARLKSYLATWLPSLPEVIALHSALPRQGGTGAVYVMLKKSRRKKEETRELLGQKTDFEDEGKGG